MAIIRHEFIYGNDVASVGVFHSRSFTDSLCDGNIVAVRFKATGVTDFVDDWYLGLKLAGSSVLLGSDRIHITSGDLSVENTSISIPVAFQDRFQPEVLARGGGIINGPIVIIIDVDDLGASDSMAIGEPVGSGTDNAVLYIDPSGDLAQDPTRFAYQEAEGNQGSLKLGKVADTSVDSGIDISKSILQVVDTDAFSGDLDHSYFGIFSSIKRGGNNDFFQTSAIRGRARYSGSSPTGPVVTGGEFFSDNAGATHASITIQGVEGIANASESAENVQGVGGYANVASGKTITDFVAGIFGIATNGGTVPHFCALFYELILGGTITNAYGIRITFDRSGAGHATDFYGIKITGAGSTFTADNTYGIYIPAEIDFGGTLRRAIKSLSTAISEFAGPIHVPDDPYDATSWNSNVEVPTKNAVRDEVESLVTTIGTKAADVSVVHNSGAENIAGVKTFTSIPLIPDDAYDATGWDGNLGIPTKNAIRDKIEALILSGGGYSDEQAQDAIGAMIDGTLEYIDATPLLRVKDGGITLAKLANMATASFLGRNTAGTGVPEVLSVSTVRTMLGIADAMTFKGTIDCSANPNYPAADAGDTYKVSVAGKIGGASGTNVEVGDTLYCLADSTASGTQAGVGASWDILQANVDGAVTGPAGSTSGNIATFNGTNGKVIQDGGKALPSGSIVGTSDTQTLTNKRVTARIGTTASSATPTPDADANDEFTVTALAVGATFAAPTGTPTDGQPLLIRIKDDGTARSLAWNAIYRVIGVTLPTTTVISKTMYIGCVYNAADSKWDVLGVNQQA